MKFRKKYLFLILLLYLSFSLLCILYIVEAPRYAYSGFVLNLNLSICLRLLLSVFLIFFVFIFLRINEDEPVMIIFYLLVIFYFLPLQAYYTLSDMTDKSFLSCSLTFIFLLFFIRKTKGIKLATIDIGVNIKLLPIVICLFALELVVIGHAFWVSKSYVLNFDNVYVYREAYGDLINQDVWGYLNTATFIVVSPFLGMIMLVQRKYKLYMLVFLFDILLFCSSGHKATLFYFMLEMFLFFTLAKGNYKISNIVNLNKLLSVFIVAVIIVLLIGQIGVSPYIYGLTLRAFFVPAKLYNDYFQYIDTGFGMLTYQTIGANISGVSYSNIIGAFNGTGASANTGYVASAYVLGGELWVVIYTLILGILLLLVNMLFKVLNDISNIVFILFIVPMIVIFTTSSLTTAFLTGGMWLSFSICFALLLRKK